MAYYLVDYENRSAKGLESGLRGIEKLSRSDTVVVFLGKNSQVPVEQLVQCVNKSVARVVFHKCRKVARNYLDFQLVSYLGSLVGTGAHHEFYLITQDKGFGAAVDYWLDEHPEVSILIQSAIDPLPVAASAKAVTGTKAAAGAQSAAGGQAVAGDFVSVDAKAVAGDLVAAGAKAAVLPQKQKAPKPHGSKVAGERRGESGPAEIRPAAPKPGETRLAEAKPAESKPADRLPLGINKLDPPESLRKIARGIYQSNGIKMGYIAQLYDAMRESSNDKAFTTRLRNLYGQSMLPAMEDDLLDLFSTYQTMRSRS